MNKEQIISFIKTHLDSGEITREELAALARGASVDGALSKKSIAPMKNTSWNIINTLYVIGSIIGIVGVTILVNQHWSEIGFAGRIGVTLGLSFIVYVTAILLCKTPQQMISQVMFVISAALAPLGTYILLSRLEVPFTSLNQAMVATVLFIIYAFAQFIARDNILVIILTAFGTWAYYALLSHIFTIDLLNGDVIKWATMILGIAYICIAYGFSEKNAGTIAVGSSGPDNGEEKSVARVLYGLGTLAILGAGITIGGIMDFIYILFIFAAFYGSVYLRSQMMLIFGALFLMADAVLLTARYFIGSIGWPVALIICGFLIIAIGYLTFELNQRYLKVNR